MTLKRQLLLVSLLTLVLPWAGCQFIRETESALRASQQQMLATTAQALADALSRYVEEFPLPGEADFRRGEQLYGHALSSAPVIDGYFEDWPLPDDALRELKGPDGAIRFALGLNGPHLYLYAEVADREVVYADGNAPPAATGSRPVDLVRLVSSNPPYLEERVLFAAEAPGPLVTRIESPEGPADEPTIRAWWQDVPGGYQLEARIPRSLLGTHLGLVVEDADGSGGTAVRIASFTARSPGEFVSISKGLSDIVAPIVPAGARVIVTDAAGWRIAVAGDLASERPERPAEGGGWLRVAYDALVEPGAAATFAEPSPGGREQQPYVARALDGTGASAWFRGAVSGRAIVAVAEPVIADDIEERVLGAVILQQGTEAILSLTTEGLARLMNVTLIAMLVAGIGLLGYATWLSRRIRRLSVAAERALDEDRLSGQLPSSGSRDEIGDLSRSFSNVLSRLGDYNEYLRTLASKLSHELRTPLAIVTSSLENLEHEQLDDEARSYTVRAKAGAERLRRILSAMSEASRVEELMQNIETESFDVARVFDSAIGGYRDAWVDRRFRFDCGDGALHLEGSPELLVQMLDKLVDNAVDFSSPGDEIRIAVGRDDNTIRIDVENPGPPLPERMHGQLFDSMVSMREDKGSEHLGLGLYIARLIAEGHGGRITAGNTGTGARFSIRLPADNPEPA